MANKVDFLFPEFLTKSIMDDVLNFYEETAVIQRGGIIGVREASSAISELIEGCFGPLKIQGEVSDLSYSSSGNLHFNLKEGTASLAAICWKTYVSNLSCHPKNGSSFVCEGKLSTYQGRSTYQLIVRQCYQEKVGMGHALLMELFSKLNEEGLFSASKKRIIPQNPKKIALITAANGAAVQDVLVAAKGLMPAKIILINSAVQGASAPPSIIKAIEEAEYIDCDLIIITRGGGGSDDIAVFNEEKVIRAIARSSVPTIVAIGHEKNVTLAELAADLRCSTPTAAICNALQDKKIILSQLSLLINQIAYKASQAVRFVANKSAAALSIPFLSKNKVQSVQQLVSDLLRNISQKSLQRTRDQSSSLWITFHQIRVITTKIINKLEISIQLTDQLIFSFSETEIYGRGGTIVINDMGQRIASRSLISAGETLTIKFSDGTLSVKVL